MITLKTLAQATKQEVFNQVATHLLKQNERSCREVDGVCMYRNSRGLKCAVGCLISDDEYIQLFENNTWDYVVKTLMLAPNAHLELITELQHIHDNYNPIDWQQRLEELANRHHGLTMPWVLQ